ncbi:tumor necrosis factor receptor superfamily member 26-like [Lethenteron reissneri]|uniref:tumor necrosis factor receptor superfamily member 26-like n=1 Tax=Lethenteron reissneri TaxID=7753 RepID=UPI002AB637FE|nr:tumor necrosis factor receptor superfamily member 26-like [Lethenteron reissneri]
MAHTALLPCVVFIQIAVCVLTEAKCNDTTEYEDHGRCCEKCPPGFFMTEKCSEGSKASTCESCTEGSYSDTHNTDGQCRPCDFCNEEIHKTEVKPCTPTSNRECACESGTREFHDGGIEICYNNRPVGEELTSEGIFITIVISIMTAIIFGYIYYLKKHHSSLDPLHIEVKKRI